MTPTLWIATLWIAFAATHLGLASVRVEPRVSARIGRGAYLGLYSLVALAVFVPLVWIYFGHRHYGVALWGVSSPGPLVRALLYAGNAFAMVLVTCALVRPSPAGVLPGDPTPRGVYRLTRHPLMMGFALIGLLHLPPNGAGADVAFFGGLVLFPLVGSWHQDRRKLHDGDAGFRAFYDATPFLPFTGGDVGRGLREMGLAVPGVGLAVALGVRLLHGSLW